MAADNFVWLKSLLKLPKFSPVTIGNHLKTCGKSSVGHKSYKFFTESYIHDVYVAEDVQHSCKVKGRCYRSQRKNESPHSIFVSLNTVHDVADVKDASCSCKAGSGGHCNHVFALLYLLNHWSMLGLKDIPAELTCTSVAQQWHKPRQLKIESEPIMKCSFVKSASDKDCKRTQDPVACKLYDARAKKLRSTNFMTSNKQIAALKKELIADDKQPPFSYLLAEAEESASINTVFGNVPVGSILGYQLVDNVPNKITFTHDRLIACSTQPRNHAQEVVRFPELPRTQEGIFMPPKSLQQPQLDFLESLSVDINTARAIEQATVCQVNEKMWHQQRKLRLTASNFGRVLIRKKPPTQAFLKALFHPKKLDVPSVNHGKKNEAVARSIYCRKMQNQVHQLYRVYDIGLIITPTHPYLGATPDGKVFDPTAPVSNRFGLLEIKCPFSVRHCSIEEACQSPDFICKLVEGVPKLKQEHCCGYYAQVQGQLALSGLQWCDFVVYLTGSQCMNVERICFDTNYWLNTILPKLSSFYFEHAIKYLQDTTDET